jgi:lysozyme
MQQLSYSEEGIAMTKNFEGLRLTAYQDVAGVWTIGYGHTGSGVCLGLQISEAEAEAYLRLDLMEAIACVNRAVTVPLSQNQFNALVDFCFNAGRGNFLQSTLLRKVNDNDFRGAVAQFPMWVHAGGRVASGLVRRRKAEAAMFASAC